MYMSSLTKRMCSFVLVLVMLMGMIPTTVFAQEVTSDIYFEELNTDIEQFDDDSEESTESEETHAPEETPEPEASPAPEETTFDFLGFLSELDPNNSIVEVTSAEQLEQALSAGCNTICIAADFELDRTFYIANDVVIYSTEAHTLTRATSFASDIFVVGENPDGTACESSVTLILGDPSSQTSNLLTIDGNADAMTVDVTGTVIFVCGGSKAELYENLTVTNHKKVGNAKSLTENNSYGLNKTTELGGAVAVLAKNSAMDIYGGIYSYNASNTTGSTSIYGGAFYNYGTLNVYGGIFENNTAYRGGVFYNYVTMNLYGAEIRNNTASMGGAIYAPAASTAKTYIGENDGIAERSVVFSGNTSTGNGGAFYNAGRLTLCDAQFSGNSAATGGGALYGTGKYSAIILKDSVFSDNSALNGGAIYLTGQATSVSSANVELYVKNTEFSGNEATECGGALYMADTARAYLSKVDFSGNSTSGAADANGGAIYCTGSALEINTAEFTGNSGYNGGAVNLVESASAVMNQITADSNTVEKYGGFCYLSGASLDLYNSTIANNEAATNGGAFYIAASGSANIYNTVFERNVANGVAGALYIYTGGEKVLLHSCTYRENQAATGGALYMSSKSNVEMYKNVAIGNSATKGGFMYETTTGTTVLISDLTVSGNTATDGGPIIWGNSTGAVLNINKNNYTDLDVSGELDADYWAGAIYNKLTVNDSEAQVPEYDEYEQPEYDPDVSPDVRSANQLERALEAGLRSIRILSDFKLDRTFYVTEDTILYCDEDRTLTRAADFAENLFEVGNGRNAALSLGGGSGMLTINGNKDNMTVDVIGSVICLYGDAQAELNHNVTIVNASQSNAGTGGAAVCVMDSAVLNINGGVYSANNATNGGVVYSEATVNVSGGTFTGNSATGGGAIYSTGELSVSGSAFTGNSATNGGAIYSQNILTVQDTDFAQNTSSSNGGAIYASDVELLMTGCELTDSNAGKHGGAVYLTDGCKAEINDVVIDGSHADNNGGGIYVSGSHLSLYDSTVRNGACYAGGGICFYTDSNGEVYNTVFENNTVTGNGGALYIYTGGPEVLMHSCTFTENSAAVTGGAIYLSNASTAKLYNTTATGNSADKGGVMQITSGSGNPEVTVNGMTVSGNTAITAGPIIYGNTWNATLYINKSNHTDLDVTEALTDVYWSGAIVNKLTVIVTNDPIPPYAGFGQEDSGNLWGAEDVNSAEELEAALLAGKSEIRIMADFVVDRTFYVTSDTTIFSTAAHTLTRAADFAGDIFVIGEAADGTVCTEAVTLTMGNPESDTPNLLVIDGNKDNLTVDVTGSVFFVCGGAKAELYENLTVRNHKKTGNERTLTGNYGVSYKELVGGAVAVLAQDAAMDIYGGIYSSNGVNEDSQAHSIYGGVIYNFGTLNIYGGVFENNTSYRAGVFYNYRKMNIYNAELRNNSAVMGGVIYAPSTTSAVTVIGRDDGKAERTVVFQGNSATDGGAIVNSGKLTICDAFFTGNSAVETGGAVRSAGQYNEISVRDSVFENNSAEYGGAISATGSTLSIEGSCFSSNSAAVHGGAVYVVEPKNAEENLELTATDTVFEKNTANYNGGALYISSGARAYMSGVSFAENTAYAQANSSGSRYGGGAVYNTGSVLEMDGAEFTNNVSDFNGGAIAVYSSGTVTLNDITASGNSAVNSGGFLYNKAKMYLYNSTVTGNSSANVGGAVSLVDATVSEIYNTTFERNQAESHGGAVYAYTGGTEAIVHSCTFRQNRSVGNGGAFYVANLCDLKLYNNTAVANNGNYGGFVYETTAGTSVLVNGLKVSGNSANNKGPIFWVNNEGAIFSINKENYTDLNLINAPDDEYWQNALGNCQNVVEVSDAIPGYADYGKENPGDLWEADEVKSAAELEAALNAGTSEIRIAADFQVDRTFYITSDTILFTTDSHTLTRAKGFSGDIFVVGKHADGTACEQVVTLTLGSPTSGTENLLIIDGGAVEATGSVLTVCGIAQAELYSNLTVTNTVHSESGAAVVVTDNGVLNVHGGMYRGNYAKNGSVVRNEATLNIMGGSFVDNRAENGGVIYNTGTMTVNGGSFVTNSAENGGAVYSSGTLTATAGVFEGNTATCGGGVYAAGVVSIAGGSFTGNHAVSGGAVYTEGSLSIGVVNFNGNEASNGGAVASYGAAVRIEGGIFTDNTASNGGAVYVSGGKDAESEVLTVTGAVFSGNHAVSGGAMYLTNTDAVITQTVLNGNSADKGGAAALCDSCEVSFSDITAAENTAKLSGGVLYCENASFSLTDSTLTENSSQAVGGAVVLEQKAVMEVRGTTFESNNAATNGGAVYSSGGEGSLIDCIFTNNISDYAGGAVYANAKSVLTVTGVQASGNRSTEGGVLYVEGSSVEITDSVFNRNISDYNGGVLVLSGAATAKLHGITADGNTAVNSGAVIRVVDSVLYLLESELMNNSCTNSGGAVALINGTAAELYKVIFNGNNAGTNGGAVYIETTGTETLLHSCTMNLNTVKKNGGAVYICGGSEAKLYNTTAAQNSADKGGVLYIDSAGTTVTVNGLTVSGNSAVTEGSIIYGKTKDAILNLNKSNYVDSDVVDALDEAYWSGAIANKLKVNEITDPIPGYGEYDDESAGDMEGALEVSSAEELETALNAKEKYIRIVSDFEIDRTFYITYDVTIFSTAPYTLTRAADFGGDIFVVGEAADGSNVVHSDGKVVLTLGNPQSETNDLLTIDGNKENMTVPVVGTVIFVCNGAQADLYENLSVVNCYKTGNERTMSDKYVLARRNRIGGPVSIVVSGRLNVYGGIYKNNRVNEEDSSSEETRNSTQGGVFYNNSNLRIYDGLFENNQGARGGIVYNYCEVDIYGGSFIGNTATVTGGVYYAISYATIQLQINGKDNEVVFKNNTAANSGGVIYSAHWSAVNIQGNVLFEGNQALNGSGGVAYSLGQFTARNTTFRNNSAKEYGGIFYFSNSTEDYDVRLVDLTGCTFEGNQARYGGVLAAYASTASLPEGANVTITDCTFNNNQAIPMSDTASDAYGGVLYVGRKSKLTVTDTSFSGNSCTSQGGVLYASGEARVSFKNVTSIENRSGNHGGAIALHSAYLDLTDVTFEKNHSGGSGGALYNSYSSSSEVNSTVNISGSEFVSNTSDGHGGAIYATKHTVEKEHKILDIVDTSFSYNDTKGKGGAVLLTAGSQTYMKDVSFVLNSASGSGESNGGAIAVMGSMLEIDGATFTRNTSTYYGGALSLTGSSGVILHEITASRNQAVKGGFLYSEGAELELYDSVMNSNTAKNGGAIYLGAGAYTGLYNSSFDGNEASGENDNSGIGGALFVYTEGALTTVHSCTFESNSADTLGGGMYISGCSLVELYNLTATSNSADKGGFLFETKADTSVLINGLTVSGNTAVTGGPIIWGNTLNALLEIDKSHYTDLDFSGELDETYWASAIANLLTVNEISEEIPVCNEYLETEEEEEKDVQKEPVSVNDVFALGLSSSDGVINSTYGKLPRLDNSSNFMSRGTTTFDNINGETVTVDSFVYPNRGTAHNGQVGLGLMLYQALLYKQKHPDEEMYIDVSAYRFSVQAAVNINRNSRYFGYMRDLVGKNYDEYGFVRISYLLITAAKMGIHVTAIGQLDGYPKSSKDPNFYNYFTNQLNDPCDPDYVKDGVIGDYLTFRFCYWTLDGKGGTDMMHTKLCAVSHYLDMNGVEHKNAVWTSSSNLDGIRSSGANGQQAQQTATIISNHEGIYRTSVNYLRLIADYCGQEEIIEFQDLVNTRSEEQIKLIRSGREDMIPENEQIVYLGGENDPVFELYFTPFGGNVAAWDEVHNPYCKYVRELYESEDYILFTWNVPTYTSSYPLLQQIEKMIIDSFLKNRNEKNKIYVNLGSGDAFNKAAFDELIVGQDIGFKSFNQKDFGSVHNKDIQLSYMKDGQRYFVSLLNSLNFHSGSMSYQSNFVLVIKETSCAEDSVFATMTRLMTKGDIAAHSYGEEKVHPATSTTDGYIYRSCQWCGDMLIGEAIHSGAGEWIVDREATTEVSGIRHKECVVCGELLEACEFRKVGLEGGVQLDWQNLMGRTFSAEDKVRIDSSLETTPHTFEAVIQLPENVDNRGGIIVGNYGSQNSGQISFEIYTDGKPRLYCGLGKKTASCVFETDIRASVPTHIAVTVDGTVVTLYVNGEAVETQKLSMAYPTSTEGFGIGGDDRLGNGEYFKGRLYSVHLFGDVRTAEEIKRDAVLVTSDVDALLYQQYFDVGNETTLESAALMGHTFRAGDVCTIDKVLAGTPYTIEATVQISKSISDRAGVIVGNYDGGNGAQINLEIYKNGRPRLFYIAGEEKVNCLFSTDIRSSEPVHIAVTVSGKTAKLYVNGVAVESKSLSVAYPMVTTNFRIGGDNRTGNDQYFKGIIYSVNLFGDVRTAEEIKGDAVLVTRNADALLHSVYFENQERVVDTVVLNGRTFGSKDVHSITKELAGTPKTIEATILVPKSISGRAGVVVGNYNDGDGVQINLEIYTNGRPRLFYNTGEKKVTCLFSTDIRSAVPTHVAVTVSGKTAILYVNGVAVESKALSASYPTATKNFKIGGDNRTGNGQYFKGIIYAVNLFGDVRTAEEIKRDMVWVFQNTNNLLYSASFDKKNTVVLSGHNFETGDVVAIDNALAGTPYTIEATIQVPKSVSERAGVIVGNYTGGSEAQINLEIYEKGRPRLFYTTGTKKMNCLFSTDVRSSDPTHIAVTVSGKTATLYVNGVAVEKKLLSVTYPTATTNFKIGGDNRSGGDQYFKGTIYSVNLFGDVRTAEEIRGDAVLVAENADALLHSVYFEEQVKVFDTTTLTGQTFHAKDSFKIDGTFTSAPRTIEAIIQVPKSINDRAGVVVGNYDDSNGAQVNLEIYKNGSPRLFYSNGTKQESCLFTTDIRSNVPVHVAVTVDGKTAKLYVNGVAVEKKTLSITYPSALENFRIGGDNRQGNTQYFKGIIYAVSLFSDVRTADEIARDVRLVSGDAQGLMYSRYFWNNETTVPVSHTEGEWITDYEASPSVSGIKHKECTVCGQILKAAEILVDEECIDHINYGQLSGLKVNSQEDSIVIEETFSKVPRTFEALFRLTPDCTQRAGVIVGNYDGSTEDQINLEIYTNGQPRLYFQTGTKVYSYIFSTDVRSQNLTHIAVAVDGTEAKLYVNGEWKETVGIKAQIPDVCSGFRIGSDNRTTSHQLFMGTLYAVTLFDHVRSDEEIRCDAILMSAGEEGVLYSECF